MVADCDGKYFAIMSKYIQILCPSATHIQVQVQPCSTPSPPPPEHFAPPSLYSFSSGPRAAYPDEGQDPGCTRQPGHHEPRILMKFKTRVERGNLGQIKK